MIAATTFAGRRVALFGLGGSGLATAQSLMAGGAHVVAWDESEASRAKAAARNIPITDLNALDWSQFQSLVLAPGVPLTHPAPHWSVVRAQGVGVEIIGDIEIFCRERMAHAPDSPFIAITGTNGKSTTTALIAHLFAEFGHDVQMGGNIGVPILSLEPTAANRVHLIELSTFQIDLTPSLNPTIGVLLNVTPDHLDRHGTLERYASIKERLVTQSARAIVSIDDAHCVAVADRLQAAGVPLTRVSGGSDIADGIGVDGAIVFRRAAGKMEPLSDLAGIGSLRGRHNAQNAAAAVASLGDLASDHARLQRALKSFPGLAHRMEEVGRIGRTLFINDSKATNADAAEKALSSFDDIFWIAGGRAKAGGLEPLRPLFPRLRKAYLIGEAAPDFARTLGDTVAHEMSGTLEHAVAAATRDAQQSGARKSVVLLSPACASYDQFKNFEARGDAFRTLVHALVEKIAS